MFFRVKDISSVQHVNDVAAGKGRGTVNANSLDLDESMIARNICAGVTCIEQVEAFMVGRRVRNKRCGPM